MSKERLWQALGPEGQQAVRNIAAAFGPLDSTRTAGRIGDEQVLGEDWRTDTHSARLVGRLDEDSKR